MKVIILKEQDFVALMDRIALTMYMERLPSDVILFGEKYKMTRQDLDILLTDLHGRFHHEIVKWAQSHGASCIR